MLPFRQRAQEARSPSNRQTGGSLVRGITFAQPFSERTQPYNVELFHHICPHNRLVRDSASFNLRDRATSTDNPTKYISLTILCHRYYLRLESMTQHRKPAPQPKICKSSTLERPHTSQAHLQHRWGLCYFSSYLELRHLACTVRSRTFQGSHRRPCIAVVTHTKVKSTNTCTNIANITLTPQQAILS